MAVGDTVRVIHDGTSAIIKALNGNVATCEYVPRVPVMLPDGHNQRRGLTSGELMWEVFIIDVSKLTKV